MFVASAPKHDGGAVSTQEKKEPNEDRQIARYTLLLVLGTFGIAIVGGAQFEISRRTAKRQLRAYVSVSPNFISSFNPTTRANVSFAITNYGATPASKVVQSAVVDIFPYPLPENFPFPELTDPARGRFVIHPSETFIGNRTARRCFTANEITEVVAGTHSRIYIFGEVSYLDVFGVTQITRFCSSIVGSENLAAVAGLCAVSFQIGRNSGLSPPISPMKQPKRAALACRSHQERRLLLCHVPIISSAWWCPRA